MHWRSTINTAVKLIQKASSRRIAILWQRIYKTQNRLEVWKLRYGSIMFYAVLLIFVSASTYIHPALQNALASYYATGPALEGLRSLILNVGSALIGATAIVTSLVMFAMQVNIERMPHGLFRRLSADQKLIGAFALAFILAIAVATLSTFLDEARLSLVVLSASWAVLFILISFMYAYQRALVLINPLQQLDILFEDTRKELRTWAKRARRATPLLECEENASNTISQSTSTHDIGRTAYFQINTRWTDGTRRAIKHAMSFAQRYAEQGDYEISYAALNTVVRINTIYIESKGKTFYVHNPFVESHLSSDSFINDTLELLRQNSASGIARRDEQQITQTLRAMAALVKVYIGIDYSSPYAFSKSHAQLAAGYLTTALQVVVPHDMTDVVLEGQRLMGKTAQNFLASGNSNDITTLSEKIAEIACTGCVKKDYFPVTMEGMMQLANLTIDLILYKSHDNSLAFETVRRNVALVAKLFILKVPDSPLARSHSMILGPYYSSTSASNLRLQLTELANAICDVSSDDKNAQSIIRNIEQWANGLYRTEKELFLEAVKLKSPFAFDILYWITDITKILLAVSNAPACDEHSQKELQKHARWLISIFTWIPDEKDLVAFVENSQMTELLFQAAINAYKYKCDDIADEIGDQLLSWTLKGGKYQTGQNILAKGLFGLAALALKADDTSQLKKLLLKRLSEKSAPEQEIRNRVAREMLKREGNLCSHRYRLSRIDAAIYQSDHQKLRPLLKAIAKILSPGIAESYNDQN